MNTAEKNIKNRASSTSDWEEYYGSRGDNDCADSVDLDDFRNLPHKILIDIIQKHITGKRRVIEIGAGDSDLLIEIGKKFNPEEIYGLDYLESACARLSEKSKQAGVDVQAVCADMFSPPHNLLGKFDFVMSYGVVEHFHDLTGVLCAIGKFVADDGLVFTLIPNNKSTVYGWLMKRWNIDVYNAHVMYDLDDFRKSHKQAGLDIVWCDYLVSSNFSMLSWCFIDRASGFNYWFYKQLTRVSKLVWFVESKIGLFKALRITSPYIVCVSKPAR